MESPRPTYMINSVYGAGKFCSGVGKEAWPTTTPRFQREIVKRNISKT